jgi:hypothetical protein
VGHFRGSENPDTVKFADAVRPQVISAQGCLITNSKEDPALMLVAMECCHWMQRYAATSGTPDALIFCHQYDEILPPGAIQSCHLNESGLEG